VAIDDQIRRRLAMLASSRKTRRVSFSAQSPCDWHPAGITDPRTRVPFTEDGAWEYICGSIRALADIDEVVLKHPAGKKGYVMLLTSATQKLFIYVKLQLLSDCVAGRSFHYSYTSHDAE
jgi:hypothetical protein